MNINITKEQFDKAIEETNNPIKVVDSGFKGMISHDNMVETWVQVDTREFEYVSELHHKDGSTYYKGSK